MAWTSLFFSSAFFFLFLVLLHKFNFYLAVGGVTLLVSQQSVQYIFFERIGVVCMYDDMYFL